MYGTDVSHIYYGGLLSIIQAYKEKTAFWRFLAVWAVFLLVGGVLYHRGKNMRLNVFFLKDSAALYL